MRTPFERVVAEHGATVLRVCRAALGGVADAEDAWSETFLSAFIAWPELDADANVQAWLVRIAQRKSIDILRRRTREPTPTGRLPEPAGRAAEAAPSDLWEAVAALPQQQRLAIAYHYFGGLPHVETAALLGRTPESVRRASADGLKTLRRHLCDVTIQTPKESAGPADS